MQNEKYFVKYILLMIHMKYIIWKFINCVRLVINFVSRKNPSLFSS